ncbi:hypothetical protein BC831DRAFT_477157 [Entophlyctis helioformis]|nr:hypothetical protein BC831DRAFT_477157 [Entophlyctis helioformis]
MDRVAGAFEAMAGTIRSTGLEETETRRRPRCSVEQKRLAGQGRRIFEQAGQVAPKAMLARWCVGQSWRSKHAAQPTRMARGDGDASSGLSQPRLASALEWRDWPSQPRTGRWRSRQAGRQELAPSACGISFRADAAHGSAVGSAAGSVPLRSPPTLASFQPPQSAMPTHQPTVGHSLQDPRQRQVRERPRQGASSRYGKDKSRVRHAADGIRGWHGSSGGRVAALSSDARVARKLVAPSPRQDEHRGRVQHCSDSDLVHH